MARPNVSPARSLVLAALLLAVAPCHRDAMVSNRDGWQTGLIPLTALGAGTYLGYQGGRYPEGLEYAAARSRGWRAGVEDRILDGLGSVDVALRKGDHSVACEIGVATSSEHEVQKIPEVPGGWLRTGAHGLAGRKDAQSDQGAGDALEAESPLKREDGPGLQCRGAVQGDEG